VYTIQHIIFKILSGILIRNYELFTSGSQKMNEVIANYFPNSIDDFHDLNEIIIKDAEFVEVQTRSPRLSELKSVVPVFVIPGFRPKLFETLYKQFFYPVFEARLPEHIDSIDELSRTLVDVN